MERPDAPQQSFELAPENCGRSEREVRIAQVSNGRGKVERRYRQCSAQNEAIGSLEGREIHHVGKMTQ